MSLPAYTVTVAALDASSVELLVEHPHLPGAPWPGLVPALLSDRGLPAPAAVELLHREPGQMRVRIDDPATARLLQAEECWPANPQGLRPPTIGTLSWAPDGAHVLLGHDDFAERRPVSESGPGESIQVLSHPHLHTVSHGRDRLMTVGGRRCVLWDLDGAVLLDHHADDTLTAAALVAGVPVVGTQGGRVYTLGDPSIDLVVGDAVTALEADPGCILVAAGGVVQCFNLRGQRIARYETGRAITALAIAEDGRLAAGDDQGRVTLWSETTEELPTYDIRVDVYSSRFAGGGQAVLTSGFGGYGWVVPVQGEPRTFSDMPGVAHLFESPSGRWLGAANQTGTRLALYEAETGRCSRLLEGMPEMRTFAAAFSPDETRLAIVRKDADNEGLLVVEVDGSGAVRLDNPTPPRSQLLDFTWLDDDRILAACCNAPNRVWRLSDGSSHTEVPDHNFPKIHPGCGPGLVALCNSTSEPLTVLDSQTLAVRHTLYESGIFAPSLPPRAHLSLDGTRALLTNTSVGAYVAYADRPPWCVPQTQADGRPNNAHGIVSPCGRWVAVNTRGTGIQVADTEAQQVVARRQTTQTSVPMAFVGDTLRLLDGTTFVDLPLDGSAAVQHGSWPFFFNPAYGVAHLDFLPDGRVLVATRYVSRIWNGQHYDNVRDSGRLWVRPDGQRAVLVQGGVWAWKDMAWV